MKSTLIVGIGASLLTAGIAKAQQRQDITPRTPNVLFIYADEPWDMETWNATRHASEKPRISTDSPRTASASPMLTRPLLPVRPPDIPC